MLCSCSVHDFIQFIKSINSFSGQLTSSSKVFMERQSLFCQFPHWKVCGDRCQALFNDLTSTLFDVYCVYTLDYLKLFLASR